VITESKSPSVAFGDSSPKGGASGLQDPPLLGEVARRASAETEGDYDRLIAATSHPNIELN